MVGMEGAAWKRGACLERHLFVSVPRSAKHELCDLSDVWRHDVLAHGHHSDKALADVLPHTGARVRGESREALEELLDVHAC